MPLPIFPQSGFDESVTTPVLFGVLVSWVAVETLGWVFAGLVVPGYLGAVFLLDPAGGIIDVFEAVVTYVAARGIGEHLAKTGVTSRVFGRERFFLIVLLSILVRLAVEGLLLPKVAPHATWAFSIGLVVVPLTANACWKTGIARGFLQNGVPTLIVYLLLRFIFVPYTNLSLEGFELATENVSASFLSSPQAYILLLTGAVLAAAANVKYGWDFNGILVPALIGLVVMQPVKLAATFIEAIALVFLVHLIVRITPLKRANIEGPRRTVLFFSVDYAARFAFAGIVGRALPGDDIVTLMGFGYLLPTLLAVKMSQKGSVALVALPALKVSVASFVVGTLIGFTAHSADGFAKTALPPVIRDMPEPPRNPARTALWIAASMLETVPEGDDRAPPPAAAQAGAIQRAFAGIKPSDADRVTTTALDAGCILVREKFEKLDNRVGIPAVIVHGLPQRDRLVLFVPSAASTPRAAYAAGKLVAEGLADVLVLSGGIDTAEWTETAGLDLARKLATSEGRVLVLREGELSLEGRYLDSRIKAISKRFAGVDLFAKPSTHEAVLRVPPKVIDGWIDSDIPPTFMPEGVDGATQLSLFLDSLVPRGVSDTQSPEDLTELRKFVLFPLLAKDAFASSHSLARVAADSLGYRLIEPRPLITPVAPGAPATPGSRVLALVPERLPRALLFVVRERGESRTVEAPHAGRSELRDFSLRLAYATNARAILLGLYTSGGRVLHGDAFRAAHSAAAEANGATILLREGSDAQGVVSLGSWGPGSDGTFNLTKHAISQLGFVFAEKPLEPRVREVASRTVLGGTHLVGVAVDAFALEVASLDEARAAHRAFGDRVPFIDSKLSDAAAMLSRDPTTSDVPEGLRDWILSAAQEQSVVARRSIATALTAQKVKAAFVRTDRGEFLLAVGKRAGATYITAATLHPREVASTALVQRTAFSACEEILASSGACEVRSP